MFSESYEDVGAHATWGDTLNGVVDSVRSAAGTLGEMRSYFSKDTEPPRYVGRGGHFKTKQNKKKIEISA